VEALIRIDGKTAVCELHGELEACSAPQLRQVMAALTPFQHAVVDLHGVTFLDSAGLGVLVAGLRQVRTSGGDALLCNARPVVRRVLHLAGLDRIVTMSDGPWPGRPGLHIGTTAATASHPRRGIGNNVESTN
jgi:anti-sigma B factor antagonist